MIHTQNGTIVDSSNKEILLRGFVTITNNTDGSPNTYSVADYQRIAGLGANFQSIRIGAGALGAWPGEDAKPAYLTQLDSMVANAKQVGLYSEFKLTLYDVGGAAPAQVNETWNQFWNTSTGTQDALLAGWATLWQRYVNESMIVGYDLLNEPQQGTLGLDDKTFATAHLNPFYNKAIDQLRTLDTQHVAFIQPPYQGSYDVPVNRDQIVYAPHFYPNLSDYLSGQFVTTDYVPTMQQFQSEAAIQKAPLYIGEYSMPMNLNMDDDATFQQNYLALEQLAVSLLTKNNLSFTRPWYADDASAISLAGGKYGWGFIKGDAGLDGPFRKIITDTFAAAVKS